MVGAHRQEAQMSRVRVATTTALVLACAAPAASATPPGANGQLIWQRESRSTPPSLYVGNPDGTGVRRVFSSFEVAFEGAFSPFAPTQMAFNTARRAPFSEDIVLGDLATGAATVLRRPKRADIAPTFSPDGLRIAFFTVPRPARFNPDRPPPPEQIHVMNADGTGDRRLTPAKRRSVDPDWSPDGTRIVYSQARMVRGRGEIRISVMNADGTGNRALSAFGGRDEINPKWTPDGTSIVFESRAERGTKSDIRIMAADGTNVRTILATAAWETNPIPSPDGTRIAFTSDRARRGRDRLGNGFELYTMSVQGTDIVRVTNNKRADIFPDWQRLSPLPRKAPERVGLPSLHVV
jgi:Tol biopolymer transport system component